MRHEAIAVPREYENVFDGYFAVNNWGANKQIVLAIIRANFHEDT